MNKELTVKIDGPIVLLIPNWDSETISLGDKDTLIIKNQQGKPLIIEKYEEKQDG